MIRFSQATAVLWTKLQITQQFTEPIGAVNKRNILVPSLGNLDHATLNIARKIDAFIINLGKA